MGRSLLGLYPSRGSPRLPRGITMIGCIHFPSVHHRVTHVEQSKPRRTVLVFSSVYRKSPMFNLKSTSWWIITRRTPWSWHTVSIIASERAILVVSSLGVLYVLANPVQARRRTVHFLAQSWLAFTGHVVLFWLWLPGRGRWTGLV